VNAGLRTWLEAFQEALDNWQDDVCQRLLREIKQAPLTPEVEGLVRYVEGRWAEQRGELDQAVRAYQASLDLNRAAGAALRVAQVLGDLGLAYHALGQLNEAEESLRTALEIYQAVDDHDAIFGALNDLGTVLIG
jgi:tetratricopeptide (TPR) repeat protein